MGNGIAASLPPDESTNQKITAESDVVDFQSVANDELERSGSNRIASVSIQYLPSVSDLRLNIATLQDLFLSSANSRAAFSNSWWPNGYPPGRQETPPVELIEHEFLTEARYQKDKCPTHYW